MSDEQARREAWTLLAHVVEPGDDSVARLVERHGPVETLARLQSGSTSLRHGEALLGRLARVDAALARERAAGVGARIVTREDPEWPTQLDALGRQAPMALWLCGAADLRLIALRSVAVVGARACSLYGEEVARSWSADLAAAGWTVLSGAAFGIDAAAHRGALAAGGVTVAVLAGGVDVPYPRAHAALIASIIDDGLVVSESPPGESVRRQRFLSRNRLIAALTRATVVVEAAVRSGTSATARVARELGRVVLAVPGPVTSPASAGCHRMIADGEAALVTDVSDLFGLLELGQAAPAAGVDTRAQAPARDRLARRERAVLDAMPSRVTVDLGEVVTRAAVPTHDALAALGVLAADGWVLEEAGGWRVVPRA